jgi:quinol monooxygenase YgiN
MSVIVTLRIKADAGKLESWASEHQDVMASVSKKAEQRGMIAHRFYSDGSGNVMVLDEWPDAQSFQAFFSDAAAEIGPMMAAVDAEGQPEVSFWQELNTPDRYGWGIEAGMR